MPNICNSLNNNLLFRKWSLSKTLKISCKVLIYLANWIFLRMYLPPWKVSAMKKILITAYHKSSVVYKDVHQKRSHAKVRDIQFLNPQEEIMMSFSKFSMKSSATVPNIHWLLWNPFLKNTKRTLVKSSKSKRSIIFINLHREKNIRRIE